MPVRLKKKKSAGEIRLKNTRAGGGGKKAAVGGVGGPAREPGLGSGGVAEQGARVWETREARGR